MASGPWTQSAHSYAGWVPNVGSHLSFSLIGSGRGPGITHFTQNFDGRIGRMVCLLQRRETDDFLTWRWLTRLISPDVVQHWLLVGSTERVTTHIGVTKTSSGKRTVDTATDDQGALRGSIYMMPWQPDPRKRQIFEWMLDEARAVIQPRKHVGASKRQTDKQMEEMASELHRLVRWRAPAAMRIEFALMRTGELRLWYAEDVLKRDIPAGRLRVNARQAYFFVKDMVHHHTHHEPSSDQITPLVPVGTASAARRKKGETNWRRETVWALSRAVEVLLRGGSLTDLRQAMGILAYADAFQKTLLPYLRHHKNATKFIANGTVYAYDYAHIKDSTRVLIEQAQARRTHTTTMLIAVLASSIAALSLLSSLVSTHNSEIDAPAGGGIRDGLIHLGVPESWLGSIAHAPIMVIALVAFGVALISMIVSDGGARLLRHSPRKFFQAARGVSLSLARRLGWRALGAHLILLSFYFSLVASLTVSAVLAPSFIHYLFNWWQ